MRITTWLFPLITHTDTPWWNYSPLCSYIYIHNKSTLSSSSNQKKKTKRITCKNNFRSTASRIKWNQPHRVQQPAARHAFHVKPHHKSNSMYRAIHKPHECVLRKKNHFKSENTAKTFNRFLIEIYVLVYLSTQYSGAQTIPIIGAFRQKWTWPKHAITLLVCNA